MKKKNLMKKKDLRIEDLYLFSASSANDKQNKNLWVKGASLFIPQINQLLEHTNYNFKIIDIETFQNDNVDRLRNILASNKSDKSTTHNYHILYSFIFNKLREDINILEIGLGTNNPTIVSTMGINGRPGASLYAFREYLPNANIFGGDIDHKILFQSTRIKTSHIDQLNYKTFDTLSKNFENITYDLIIDDGLHAIGANFNTLLFALRKINENGWIVIEDIHFIENWKSIDFILQSTNKYKTYIVRSKKAYLYVVNKL